MSDFVWMLCWNRVWPEPLLLVNDLCFIGYETQLNRFFFAGMNPGLQIFRVEKDYWLDLV
ncbi:unnamed protein product [Brassica rapa subsp. narinosa]